MAGHSRLRQASHQGLWITATAFNIFSDYDSCPPVDPHLLCPPLREPLGTLTNSFIACFKMYIKSWWSFSNLRVSVVGPGDSRSPRPRVLHSAPRNGHYPAHLRYHPNISDFVDSFTSTVHFNPWSQVPFPLLWRPNALLTAAVSGGTLLSRPQAHRVRVPILSVLVDRAVASAAATRLKDKSSTFITIQLGVAFCSCARMMIVLTA